MSTIRSRRLRADDLELLPFATPRLTLFGRPGNLAKLRIPRSFVPLSTVQRHKLCFSVARTNCLANQLVSAPSGPYRRSPGGRVRHALLTAASVGDLIVCTAAFRSAKRITCALRCVKSGHSTSGSCRSSLAARSPPKPSAQPPSSGWPAIQSRRWSRTGPSGGVEGRRRRGEQVLQLRVLHVIYFHCAVRILVPGVL